MGFKREWIKTEYTSLNYTLVCHAVEGISNQKYLAKIAKFAKAFYIRELAIEKLSIQKTLIFLAKNDPNEDIRILAVKRITDSKYAEPIALLLMENATSNYNKIEAAAVIKNTSAAQSVLTEIIDHEQNYSYILKAALLLTNQDKAQEAFKKVAMSDEAYRWDRIEAIGHINEQSFLYVIAKQSDSGMVCFNAAKRLTNDIWAQDAFKSISKNDSFDDKIRYEAVLHLEDKNVALIDLKSIMNNVKPKIHRQSGNYTWVEESYQLLYNNCEILLKQLDCNQN